MITRQRFWMCFVDESDYPRIKHYEEKDAMNEAERLAARFGKDVFLLEASKFVRFVPPIPSPVIEWKETIY